jgi:hypothetical protein
VRCGLDVALNGGMKAGTAIERMKPTFVISELQLGSQSLLGFLLEVLVLGESRCNDDDGEARQSR